jgi:hypothetical protein
MNLDKWLRGARHSRDGSWSGLELEGAYVVTVILALAAICC